MRLHTNIRVRLAGDPSAAQFQTKLLSLGDGRLRADSSGLISFPLNFCNLVTSLAALQDTVFPNIRLNSLEMFDVPQHNLVLKIGAPIMLLRNLDPQSCVTGHGFL